MVHIEESWILIDTMALNGQHVLRSSASSQSICLWVISGLQHYTWKWCQGHSDLTNIVLDEWTQSISKTWRDFLQIWQKQRTWRLWSQSVNSIKIIKFPMTLHMLLQTLWHHHFSLPCLVPHMKISVADSVEWSFWFHCNSFTVCLCAEWIMGISCSHKMLMMVVCQPLVWTDFVSLFSSEPRDYCLFAAFLLWKQKKKPSQKSWWA